MIKVLYREEEDGMILRAEGHAGYAPAGHDIVCAGVSALIQALAYSVDDGETGGAACFEGKNGPVMTVQARYSDENRAKFEVALDGMILLSESYPDYVELRNECGNRADLMDLQFFAEGGGDGGAAGGEGGEGAADGAGISGGIELPKMSPAEERQARRSGTLKASRTQEGSTAKESVTEGESGSDPEEKSEEAAPNEEGVEETKTEKPPEERRKAFGQLMQGEYKAEFEQMMQKAIEMASQSITADPKMKNLMGALAEAYGVESGDLDELTEAVKNGRVKDEAYFERIAMEKGISVKTAKELDKLESENRRMTAAQAAAEAQRKAAQRQAEIAQIHEAWNREAAQLKEEYPDFDLKEMLENEQAADLMRRGVSMSNAYRAIFFDRIMAQNTAKTAQQVERGVEARIQQRSTRPGENGTRPGGAAQMKLDVNAMTKRDREKLEREVLRGKKIMF